MELLIVSDAVDLMLASLCLYTLDFALIVAVQR